LEEVLGDGMGEGDGRWTARDGGLGQDCGPRPCAAHAETVVAARTVSIMEGLARKASKADWTALAVDEEVATGSVVRAALTESSTSRD
jgi:hypothetical protein